MSTQELLKELGKASFLFPCPKLKVVIDRSVFRKTEDDKGKLITLKSQLLKKRLVSIGKYQF